MEKKDLGSEKINFIFSETLPFLKSRGIQYQK